MLNPVSVWPKRISSEAITSKYFILLTLFTSKISLMCLDLVALDEEGGQFLGCTVVSEILLLKLFIHLALLFLLLVAHSVHTLTIKVVTSLLIIKNLYKIMFFPYLITR